MTESVSGRASAPAGACPACGAERTEPDACDRCGAVYGDRHRCPHCGGTTRTEPDANVGLRCAACGGPRVRGVGRDDALEAKLRDAHRARGIARSAGVAHGFFVAAALLGVVASLVWLATAGLGPVSAVVLLAWIGGALLGARALRRTREHGLGRAADALAVARARAGEVALVEAGGTITAEELAPKLGTSVDDAQRVLTTLATSERVRIEVEGDDTRVRYSLEPVLEAGDDDSEAAPLSDQRRRSDRSVG